MLNLKENSRNKVKIGGTLEDEFRYSYTNRERIAFFKNTLKVIRRDGNADYITIIMPYYKVRILRSTIGEHVTIVGTIKTVSVIVEKEKTNKDVIVIAEEIESSERKNNDDNFVYLEGTIMKRSIQNKTLNNRIINFIRVKKDYKNTSIIPCKFYKKQASRIIRIIRITEGTRVQIYGEIERQNKLRLFEDGSMRIVPIHNVKVLRFNVIRD